MSGTGDPVDRVRRRLAAEAERAPAGAQAQAREPAAERDVRPPAYVWLQWLSLCHSCIYLALLVCAFGIGSPQPATFVLGLSHGLLWIFMSMACIAAARARIVPLRLAVAVAVLGGIGPLFGTYEFWRLRRSPAAEPATVTVSAG